LGQIGDKQAVSPLLSAAEGTADRFIQHAIIYSLISLNEADEVRKGLANSSPQVREAAFIALDQMPGSPLTAGELTTFLSEKNEKLQQSALWIASHHPEWSRELITFLDKRLKTDSLNAQEEKLYTDILVSFGDDAHMQKFIAGMLNTGTKQKKLFILDVMGKMKVKTFPALWINQLGQLLHASGEAQVKSKTIELVQMRGIRSLDNKLLQVADDENNTATIRIQALTGIINKKTILSDKHFSYLYEQLTMKNEVSVRQQVAAAFEKANLSEDHLLRIAMQYLPGADPFILPRLVPVFSGAHSTEIGNTVAKTLAGSPTLDAFSEENVRKLFEKYPADVQPAVELLLVKLNAVRAERLMRLQDIEKDIVSGVLDRGRVLFFGKATCYRCHTIGPQGGKFGPDLTSIQRDRSVHDLLEAVVYPGATFVREFETYSINTKSGKYTGIIKLRTPEVIVLETSPQSSVRIARNDIITTEVLDVSMMPPGLDKLLTRQEMADLMTFLLGQDQDPETDQRILRHTSYEK
jgi:putative heme-binding domain-containing protein